MRAQRDLRKFFSDRQGPDGFSIEESVVVASPPSIVLEEIERYLTVREAMLDVIPTETLTFGRPTLEGNFRVQFESHPNCSIIGRYDDRLSLCWGTLTDELRPSFCGRLTIRPAGTKAELILKGLRQSPLDTSPHRLLNELRDVLEIQCKARLSVAMSHIVPHGHEKHG
jgi:hypothetical protein